jgi:hypothetical protein
MIAYENTVLVDNIILFEQGVKAGDRFFISVDKPAGLR